MRARKKIFFMRHFDTFGRSSYLQIRQINEQKSLDVCRKKALTLLFFIRKFSKFRTCLVRLEPDMRIGYNIRKKYEFVKAYFICIYLQKSLVLHAFFNVYSYMRYGENMKNLVENAFGDIVERTDYGNHKNQLNLFDNLNEVVEENITAADILGFLFKK